MCKKKRNIIKFIGISIFIIIGIPYIINKLLYLPIKTNGTTDADWLSFWGGFLGGIIGLLGVVLTIRKMDKDRKIEEDKKKPYLIPLEKVFVVYEAENPEKQMLYANYETNAYEEKWKDYFDDIINYKCNESIFIEIINVAEESAISVKSIWKDTNDNEEGDKRSVQVITRNNKGKTELPLILRYEIEKIIYNNVNKILYNELEDSFNIGQLIINSRRPIGTSIIKKYNVFINIYTKRIYQDVYKRRIFFINMHFEEINKS